MDTEQVSNELNYDKVWTTVVWQLTLCQLIYMLSVNKMLLRRCSNKDTYVMLIFNGYYCSECNVRLLYYSGDYFIIKLLLFSVMANGLRIVITAWWRHDKEAFSVLLPFVRDSTGHLWIPVSSQWASDAELWCFFDVWPNKPLNKHSSDRWF